MTRAARLDITGFLTLSPAGLGSLLSRAKIGSLTDRIGPRSIVIAGLLLTALGTLPFARAGPDTSIWLLSAALFIRGAGLASVTIAVMAGAFQQVPPTELPDASATTRIVQQIGGSLGTAVLAVILAHQLFTHHAATTLARSQAYDTAFRWAIAFSLIPLIPVILLPDTRKPAHTS
jgi:MFS family permease